MNSKQREALKAVMQGAETAGEVADIMQCHVSHACKVLGSLVDRGDLYAYKEGAGNVTQVIYSVEPSYEIDLQRDPLTIKMMCGSWV